MLQIPIVDLQVMYSKEYLNSHVIKIISVKDGLMFDLHEIKNGDDGWLDGFEIGWKDVYLACQEWIEKKEKKS